MCILILNLYSYFVLDSRTFYFLNTVGKTFMRNELSSHQFIDTVDTCSMTLY